MNIFYQLSKYISHCKAGLEYIACLELAGHRIVADPELADIAVLHDEPVRYGEYFAAHPVLAAKDTIGYCVWETDILPQAYCEGLALVRRVWTCSEFSAAAIRPHVPEVAVVPHVARRVLPEREDVAWMRQRLGVGKDTFIFYTVSDGINPRKNLPGLLAAFAVAFPPVRHDVCLVVKQYRCPLPLDGIPGVISIPEMLDDSRMAALHAIGDCCVSAHHAEAWGLSLSEAMTWGNMVIATGYSGNMQYMNPANSVPVPYALSAVSSDMAAISPLYGEEMTWADISLSALAGAMRRQARRRLGEDEKGKIRLSMRPFSRESIASRMDTLLRGG